MLTALPLSFQDFSVPGVSRYNSTMIHIINLYRLLLTAMLSIIGLGIPLTNSKDLAERDNKWNLKCSNAPTVVAGS